jgi:hypothetical protein
MKSASKGGLLVGASHKEGGIDIIIPDGKIEAEGNEIILTKGVYESTEKVDFNGKKMTKREAASALNESEGGVKIAEKGAKVEYTQYQSPLSLKIYEKTGTKIETMKKGDIVKVDGKNGDYAIVVLNDDGLTATIKKIGEANKTSYNADLDKMTIIQKAEYGTKINDMKNYYLKVGHVLVEPNNKRVFIIRELKPTGVVLEEPTIFKEEAHSELVTFNELLSLISEFGLEFKTGRLGDKLPYETDRDRILLQKEIEAIEFENERAEYGKKIESIKKSHEDTMSGVEALAAKGARIDKSQVDYYIEKYKNRMSGSSVQSSAYWVDGITELSENEKKAVWLGIVDFVDHKDFNRSQDLPSWIRIAAKGARVQNQYEGKTPERLWNDWTQEQRVHFCLDHKIPVENELLSWEDFSKNKTYVSKLAEHIEMGQYKEGGKTPTSINTIKKLTKRKDAFYAVFNTPKGGKKAKDSTWGNSLASSIKEGVKITTVQKDGRWYVKTAIFSSKGLKRQEANEVANKIAEIIYTKLG